MLVVSQNFPFIHHKNYSNNINILIISKKFITRRSIKIQDGELGNGKINLLNAQLTF